MLPELTRSSVLGWATRRQHLGAGAAAPVDVGEVMDDLLGLHATVPSSPYLQLRARVPGFAAGQLDSTLDDGRAARVGCMRRTLFVESARLVPLVLAATQSLSLRADRYLEVNGVTPDQYEALARRIESTVSGRAMTVRELTAALGVTRRLSPVVTVMCDESRLLRWRGRKGWRTGPPAYRRFDEVLPAARRRDGPGARDEAAAVRDLVERYVARYGPAGEADIAWWTGLRRSTVRAAVASLDLVPVSVEGLAGALLVRAADLDAALAAPPPEDEVCLLPVLDPYLQSHADRSRFVAPAHLPHVFDRGGNATSVVLVRGRVAGLWDHVTEPTPQVRVLFLDPPAAGTRRRVRQAAAALGAFVAGRELSVVECSRTEPLARSTGAFLSPLRTAH